ncbi:regulator of chromosome condensation-like [Drosophila pseudoobscura]|uniref:Regulator of chromosome condensation-like n=1 Tax=Drosophila pseudoobscura pseudoobscura TaxID=46245 RepID=A0A6I8VZX5_DROPS|nr:regulator of chromosome condensation-like [Drosophila pseudoobscura]
MSKRRVSVRDFCMELPKRRQSIGSVLACDTAGRLTEIQNIPDPVDVSAGGQHSLVLTRSGDVYSFGCNGEGALGRSTSSSEPGSESLPAVVDLPGKALCITAGGSHSACLLANGSVYAWGSFRLTIDGIVLKPTQILAGTECCSIASGRNHLVVLSTRGKVYTMGSAEHRQLRSIQKRSVLRPNQIKIRSANPFNAIWTTNTCCFLRESQTETIWAADLNNCQHFAPIKTTLKDVTQIAGGDHDTLMLQGNRLFSVVGLGESVSQLAPVRNLESSNIVSVACGDVCSYAITADGLLYSWGTDSSKAGKDDQAIRVISRNTANKKLLLASATAWHALFLAQVNPYVFNSLKDNLLTFS